MTLKSLIFYRMITPVVYILFWTCLESFTAVKGLDNGLALTPPMGWLAWQRYRCITDCETYPDDCVKLVNLCIVEKKKEYTSRYEAIYFKIPT